MKVEDMNLWQQLVIGAPAIFGYFAGIASAVSAAVVLQEFGVFNIGAHHALAIVFAGVSVFCMKTGSRITNEWIENIEGGEPDGEE